jgi:hypothetical protein
MTQNIDPRQIAYAAGTAREASATAQQALAVAQGHSQAFEQVNKRLDDIQKNFTVNRSGANNPPNIQYIENIPGRRVPFDLLVRIPIGANVNSQQQGSILISQEGPFVAVSRMAIFLSQYQLQRIDPVTGAKATFFGRSYGRYRPIHSTWDLMDGMPRQQVAQSGLAFPGTGAPHILSPSNGSPFRSMQADYTVKFLNAGSSFPRSNIEVPSAFWTDQVNSPFELGALDVFERGEQLTFEVQPTHINNPDYGNIQSFASANANFPFLASGWDYIEGINDQVSTDAGTTDPITRLPNGILYIGYHGYRIVQPAGSGPY